MGHLPTRVDIWINEEQKIQLRISTGFLTRFGHMTDLYSRINYNLLVL